jgi:hypothetical protein
MTTPPPVVVIVVAVVDVVDVEGFEDNIVVESILVEDGFEVVMLLEFSVVVGAKLEIVVVGIEVDFDEIDGVGSIDNVFVVAIVVEVVVLVVVVVVVELPQLM